jgi:hypothetical protein
MPLSPAASSLAERPSTMKLFDSYAGCRRRCPDRELLRSRKELVAGGVGGRDAGDEQCEVEKIAAVEREVADFGLRHGARDLTARGFSTADSADT